MSTVAMLLLSFATTFVVGPPTDIVGRNDSRWFALKTAIS